MWRHSALKNTIQEKYGSKWQVVIGKDMVLYFDEAVINHYIILQTEIKTMIIFRKKMAEELELSRTDTDRWIKREESQKPRNE